MKGTTAWILANQYTEEVGSGISNVKESSKPGYIEFTTNSGSKFDVKVDLHTHANLSTVLNKFTVNSNGDLLFNGNKLKGASFVLVNALPTTDINDDVQYLLTSDFSINVYDSGNNTWNKYGTVNNNSFFKFEQLSPSTKWKITHSLGTKTPEIMVVDSDGYTVGGQIDYKNATLNYIEINFCIAISGTAIIKK